MSGRNAIAFVLFVLVGCAIGASSVRQEKPTQPCSDLKLLTYQQINAPLAPFSDVEGFVRDDTMFPMVGACVGIFAGKEEKLIAFGVSDEKARFSLPKLPDGDYQLYISFPTFCPAVFPIRVRQSTRGKGLEMLVTLHPFAPMSYDSCVGGASTIRLVPKK